MKISIIIPVYNVAPYLTTCLDSVRAQRFQEWEAICIDDGSTDGSPAILDAFANEDGRFKVFHRNNEGVSAARNFGLGCATGDYVTFLDSDDAVADTWLDNYACCLAGSGYDVIRIGYTEFSHDDELADLNARSGDCSRVALLPISFLDVSEHGYVWSCIYSRRIVSDLKLEFPIGLGYAEDTMFNFEVLSHGVRSVQSAYAGYCYRQRPSSASGRRLTEREWDLTFDVCKRLLDRPGIGRGLGAAVCRLLLLNYTVWIASDAQDDAGAGRLDALRGFVKSDRICYDMIPLHFALPIRLYVMAGLRWPVRMIRAALNRISKRGG